MIRFCLREYYFIFKNYVMLAYLIGFAKTCPICGKIDSKVYGLTKLSLWVNTLWLEGG